MLLLCCHGFQNDIIVEIGVEIVHHTIAAIIAVSADNGDARERIAIQLDDFPGSGYDTIAIFRRVVFVAGFVNVGALLSIVEAIGFTLRKAPEFADDLKTN